MPLLALGIPGSGTTAVMLAAFQMYGLQPGPLLFSQDSELVWGLIASLYVSNGLLLVLTLPLMVPLVEGYGLDLIWFGVVVIKLLEIGLITPPVGLNVFVIAGVVGKDVPIDRIFSGILRFLTVDVLVLILIMAFPILSLLIPGSM